MPEEDKINHPRHYTIGKYEVIDIIEDWNLSYLEGNVVKYIARAKHKGDELNDLMKARWYLDRRIQQISKTPPNEYSVSNVATNKNLTKGENT